MANIKLKNNYWVTESIYDTTDSKTQKQVNADLHQDIEDLSSDVSSLNGAITNLNGLANLKGKKVSIIGDSISTFDQTGYKYDSYAMYYPRSGLDVNDVNQTWWKMLLDYVGATLEVNASYSGSCITNQKAAQGFPSFYDRCTTSILGNPDVIFVALGTNDSNAIGEYDYTTSYSQLDESTVANAYIKGIKKLQSIYPNAEIICISLRMSSAMSGCLYYIAKQLGCRFVYAGNYTTPAAYGVHPDTVGMRQIFANILALNSQFNGTYGILQPLNACVGNFILLANNNVEENPESLVDYNHIYWYDNQAKQVARIAPERYVNGDLGLRFSIRHQPANVQHIFEIMQNSQGQPSVKLEQDAWLDALSTPKAVTFGMYGNTDTSLTCTTVLRGLMLISAGNADTARYGLYIVSTSSSGVFFDPIPVYACQNLTITKSDKTLTLRATTACKAHFLLFDRGGTLTITGAST